MKITANIYRTHHCAALRLPDVGATVRLSGWVHRKRDHGNLLFVDLRDHYGITQIVANAADADFAVLDAARVESVLTVGGRGDCALGRDGERRAPDRRD